jgi:hypothetical protein
VRKSLTFWYPRGWRTTQMRVSPASASRTSSSCSARGFSSLGLQGERTVKRPSITRTCESRTFFPKPGLPDGRRVVSPGNRRR